MSKKLISKFLGLRNTGDARSAPLGSLAVSDNVMITDQDSIMRRPGVEKIIDSAVGIVSSYEARDHSAIFLISDHSLLRFEGSTLSVLAQGLSADRYVWCQESENLIFGMGGDDYFFIRDGNESVSIAVPKLTNITVTLGSGETPAGDYLISAQYVSAQELYGPMSDPITVSSQTPFNALITVPEVPGFTVRVAVFSHSVGFWTTVGYTSNFLLLNSSSVAYSHPIDNRYFAVESAFNHDVIAMTYHRGQVVVAVQDGESTKVYFSVEGVYHLFGDFFTLPDVVTDLASVNGRLLITCENAIFSYSVTNGLNLLAEYGTPKGKPIIVMPDNGCFIWTNRGMVSYPEFKNLTEGRVSIESGEGCSSALFEFFGSKYILNSNDGLGLPYNK